jgi:hypothetical protein
MVFLSKQKRVRIKQLSRMVMQFNVETVIYPVVLEPRHTQPPPVPRSQTR